MPANPLTLKQRLAALSASIPSPSSPRSEAPPDSPSPVAQGKRRAFPQIPFRKSSIDNQNGHSQSALGQEKVREVMDKLIFQAGVDYETRPMLVMNACYMPDPREVSYDLLLSRIMAYLDLYVEADYTVVFFAAGSRHSPGWNWVWKAYRSLSRKYRKNLKRLFVVHSNFFTKMLFSLAGAIISPKFFRKITYVNTLSELAYQVPITQIDIPPVVYQENLKHEKQINLPVPSRADLFGVPLEEIMGYDGEKGGLPRVVRDCIHYLRLTGLQEDGLFRRSANSVLLKQAAQAYDRGHVVSLETFGDPHLAAVLLKKYLHDLPEPIFPERLYLTIKRCPMPTADPNDMSSVTYIRETLLPELPPCFYILLSAVLHLLHDVQLRSATNRMDAHNLTIVICPNLVSSSNPIRDVMMCAVPSNASVFGTTKAPPRSPSNPAALAEGKTTLGMVIKLCIERYYEIFDEIQDRTEPLPQTIQYIPPTSPWSGSDFPGSPGSGGNNRDSAFLSDDDIDDAMLVMPIGPSGANANGSGSPGGRTGASTFRPRHRTGPSRDSVGVRSTHTAFGNGTGGPSAYGTVNRARSTISIEHGNPSRKGSIAVGRGTVRGKGATAGVQAIGITAEGFFSSPDAPPVPALPSSPTNGSAEVQPEESR